jgi:hypothetical protein
MLFWLMARLYLEESYTLGINYTSIRSAPLRFSSQDPRAGRSVAHQLVFPTRTGLGLSMMEQRKKRRSQSSHR